MKYFRAFCSPKWKLTVVQICESVITMELSRQSCCRVVGWMNWHISISTFEVNFCQICVTLDKWNCCVHRHVGIVVLCVRVPINITVLQSAAIVDKTDFVTVRFRYRSQRAYNSRFFCCHYVVSMPYFFAYCLFNVVVNIMFSCWFVIPHLVQSSSESHDIIQKLLVSPCSR